MSHSDRGPCPSYFSGIPRAQSALKTRVAVTNCVTWVVQSLRLKMGVTVALPNVTV